MGFKIPCNLTVLGDSFNQWGISLGSEKKQRIVAGKLLEKNLEAEGVPLTFPLKKGGGEEVRTTAFCYVPNLTSKVLTMVEEKQKRDLSPA